MSISEHLRERASELRQAVSDVRSKSGETNHLRGRLVALASMLEGARHDPDSGQIDDALNQVNAILDSLKSESDTQRLETTIVGCTTANMYDALADFSDTFGSSAFIERVNDQRKKYREISRKLNEAAAKGDWGEFERIRDELAAGGEIAGGSSGGSVGDSGETAPTGPSEGG